MQAEYAAAVRESYQLLQGAVTAINDALDEVRAAGVWHLLLLPWGRGTTALDARLLSVPTFRHVALAACRCRCGKRSKIFWRSSDMCGSKLSFNSKDSCGHPKAARHLLFAQLHIGWPA